MRLRKIVLTRPVLHHGPYGSVVMYPGVPYVMMESHVFDWLERPTEKDQKSIFDTIERYERPMPRNPQSVVLIRPGGIGDVLFLGPTVRKIKEMGVHIAVCSHPGILKLLDAKNGWDGFLEYPPKLGDLSSYEAVYDMDGSIENNPVALRENAYCVMWHWVARYMGLDPNDVPEPRPLPIDPPTGRNTMGAEWVRPDNETWLVVSVAPSSRIRQYPPDRMMRIVKMAQESGWRVFLTGATPEWHGIENVVRGPNYEIKIKATIDRIHDLVNRTNLRELLQILGQASIVLSCDSSTVHLSEAMGIPCVALYGSFDAKLRTSGYRHCAVLQGYAPCAPCGAHGLSCPLGHEWCIALESIPPETVWEHINDIVQRGSAQG